MALQHKMWCTPAVAGYLVFIVDTDRYLHAVDVNSGWERWRVLVGKALKTVVSPIHIVHGGVLSSPIILDGVIYFGSLGGKLYAVRSAP